jgi:hypothetical protein
VPDDLRQRIADRGYITAVLPEPGVYSRNWREQDSQDQYIERLTDAVLNQGYVADDLGSDYGPAMLRPMGWASWPEHRKWSATCYRVYEYAVASVNEALRACGRPTIDRGALKS